MKFLGCPTKCAAGIELDDSPSGTPTTSTKRSHAPEEDSKEDGESLLDRKPGQNREKQKSRIPVPDAGARSRGFKNVFRALGSLALGRRQQPKRFARPSESTKTVFKNKAKLYRVFSDTSRLETTKTVKDVPVGEAAKEKIFVEKPRRKNSDLVTDYPGSPRKLAGAQRKLKTDAPPSPNSVPPEKPKRLFAGRQDNPKKSPVLSVKKPGLRSPSASKIRKPVSKPDKKPQIVYNETSFLTTIAEETPCKSFSIFFFKSKRNGWLISYISRVRNARAIFHEVCMPAGY